eukprot:CAMPEP_0201601198 /NCGR_PEP_ID=MMETSP0492-20130828/2203_1 /ASSEMBLY_ACC=CAM_ASM_000837 /TAXON_ID=420259 /ORGANISM="Thalassiosira gravida, Strain GMp14c1" /LENGTH=126 /DNA_ID=CAMNT_0048064329 /DNA_START=93 /DNA_END=473 /DNA_ORIENTATION=+
MTAKDNYSFEPVGAVPPSAPVGEAIPSATPETYYNEDEGPPSDIAIMVGCGLLGCVIAGPFLAIVTGLGGKYIADRNQGPIGDSARALGRIAAAAGKKAKEEHLFSKLKDSVRSLFSKNDQGTTSK